jgi:hypothetical protein
MINMLGRACRFTPQVASFSTKKSPLLSNKPNLQKVANTHKGSSPADKHDGAKRPTTRMGMLAWDYKEQFKEIKEKGDMGAWEALANHKIREAISEGEFENLPGHGKPRAAGSGMDPNNPDAAGVTPIPALIVGPASLCRGPGTRSCLAVITDFRSLFLC